MKTLKHFILLILLAGQTAYAQTSTTIPPGPRKDDDRMMKRYKKNEMEKFLDAFIRNYNKCPGSPFLSFDKKEIKKLTVGDIYLKLIMLGVQKSQVEKCGSEKQMQLILKDLTVTCIFSSKNNLLKLTEKMINPEYFDFDSFIKKEFPKLSEPEQVKILFQNLVVKGKFNELQK